MSIIHASKEPINAQFNKIPYQSKPELQKLIKSLATIFTTSSKSLIQTHQIIANSQTNAGGAARLASWHNELRESIDSFRKRFGRLLGDLRYFLQTGPQEQADLESISSNLKNNDGSSHPGYLLKKELQELISIVDNSIVTTASMSYQRNGPTEIPSINTSLGTINGFSRGGGIQQQSPGRIVVNVSNDRILNNSSGTPRVNNHSFENLNGEVGASSRRISSLNKSGRRRGSIRSKVVVESVQSRGNSIDSNSSKVRRYKDESMNNAFDGSVTKKPPQAPGRTPIKIGNKLVERVEVIQETPKSVRGNQSSRNSMTKTKVEKEVVSSTKLSGSKIKTNFTPFGRSGDKRRRNSLSRSQVSVEKVENSEKKVQSLNRLLIFNRFNPQARKRIKEETVLVKIPEVREKGEEVVAKKANKVQEGRKIIKKTLLNFRVLDQDSISLMFQIARLTSRLEFKHHLKTIDSEQK